MKPTRTAPAAVAAEHAAAIAALKAEAKELTKTRQTERTRLESLIGAEETWPFTEWVEAYWHHPVTGPLGRALAWRVAIGGTQSAATAAEPDGSTSATDPNASTRATTGDATGAGARLDPPPTSGDDAGFVGFAFDDPTHWVDASGAPRSIDPVTTTIRPWHPVRGTASEIHGLRAVLTDREVRQPFKQAFREVYLLTPAERETAVYSNRFAAHVLRYQQAYALMKERGWATNYLGPWDGGGDGCAQRRFDDAGVTAQFFHDPIEGADHRNLSVELCATDQVRFIRTGDRGAVPLPLAEIDPVVLSEAMRDVDLFVGVCSIGNDPEWTDRGEDRHADYWHRYAFGELGSSAEVRRDALAVILPKLKIADRCELDERNLVVHGELGTYRIHLGSGNVMMDPSRYLCIVAGRGGAKTSKVFLPFEDDHLLTVILSKAFLLADDTKITDRTILVQIGVPLDER